MSVEVGLVGYGLGGSAFHAPLIAATDRLHLAAVATSRRPDLGNDVRITDADTLIADPSIGLIVISTPNSSHFPLARRALEAGKHVVIDKPFTVAVAEADTLIALAAAGERVLVPFHNRRWDGDYLTVKRFMGSGRLGEIVRFEAHWDRFRPGAREGWKEVPEEGAGLLPDLGPHLIDQALQLFGWPEAVQADVAVQRPAGVVDDYFHIALHYGRVRVILGSTVIGAEPRPRFAVHGTSGSLVKFGLDPQEDRMKAGWQPSKPEIGREDPAFAAVFNDGVGGAEKVESELGRYLSFYEGVAAAILDGTPPPVAAEDARDGLRIIELARESSASGQRILLS